MLYYLFRWLNEQHGFPYLVRYPSFRMAAAFLTALLFCLLVGPCFLRALRRFKLGENLDKMGPERRALVLEGKAGTPTMGGILTFSALMTAALLWARLDEPLVLIGLLVFTCATAIGYWDDRIKLLHPSKHGISGRLKLGLLSLVAVAGALALQQLVWVGGSDRLEALVLPFAKDLKLPLMAFYGLPFLLVGWAVISGTANAVNLTDGMDGLASGCLAITGIALAIACVVVGTPQLAERFFVFHVPGGLELGVLLAAMVGAALGFLWWNAAPARVFMGDVGSLGFGALLGWVAFASRMELLLVVAGGVFVGEALSVLIQVSSYKLFRKRVFPCTPIHHSFQGRDVSETQIVVRFWIVGVVLAVFSIALFKVR